MKIGSPAASLVTRAAGILALACAAALPVSVLAAETGSGATAPGANAGAPDTVATTPGTAPAAPAEAPAGASVPPATAPTPSGPAPAPLAGNAEAGAQKAAVCGACHGIDGNSVNPEWPNLAGQHHQYAVEQLHLFKGMVRANPIMQAQAMPLSDQDMADLAAYFEQQTLKGLEADPSAVQIGERLFRAGDAERGIPACIACHGAQGIGNGPAKWPSIRAQHSLYTYNQLVAYANRTRYTPVAGQPSPPAAAAMMYEIAAKLTDAEKRAIASYLQGLR